MSNLEVDRDLIDPLGGLSDDQIRKYLIGGEGKNKVNQEFVEAVRTFVKMTMAWLYTLIEDKAACQNQFAAIHNKLGLLSDLPAGNIEFSKKMRDKNRIMKCICSNDDYSREVIQDCMEKNNRLATDE